MRSKVSRETPRYLQSESLKSSESPRSFQSDSEKFPKRLLEVFKETLRNFQRKCERYPEKPREVVRATARSFKRHSKKFPETLKSFKKRLQEELKNSLTNGSVWFTVRSGTIPKVQKHFITCYYNNFEFIYLQSGRSRSQQVIVSGS